MAQKTGSSIRSRGMERRRMAVWNLVLGWDEAEDGWYLRPSSTDELKVTKSNVLSELAITM